MTTLTLMAPHTPTLPTASAKPRFPQILLATGVTLHYLEQGHLHGEPVIMLHGFTDSWNTYALALPHLSPAYHVYALDQRGHGESSKTAADFTVERFVADVVAFMDAQGIAKATVVGHSLGSMVAQLVAIHHPDRVNKLVLIGSMTVGGNPGVLEFNEAVQTLTDPIDPVFARDFQTSTQINEISPVFLDKVVAESLKVPAQVWRQTMASFVQQETTHDLYKISAPTLILWGDQDPYFLRSDQETLAALIPQATLRIYEQVSHNPHWEQPERFVADLEQFLAATAK
jgi:pimeloyl-ACP methyl ester carboxylesterase